MPTVDPCDALAALRAERDRLQQQLDRVNEAIAALTALCRKPLPIEPPEGT